MGKNLNDVIAELTLYGRTDLAYFLAKRGCFKFGHHSSLTEPSKVTAFILCPGVG